MIRKKRCLCFIFISCLVVLIGCGDNGISKSNEKHDFPESIIEYEAIEHGRTTSDITKTAIIEVAVNHCEYGEPMQYITDEKTIDEVVSAISKIEITDIKDLVNNTDTYSSYNLCDNKGDSLFRCSIQNNLLLGENGRYSAKNIELLTEITSIMSPDDWTEYWKHYEEKDEEYKCEYVISYPSSIFSAGGYSTSQLKEIESCSDIESIRIWMADSNLEAYYSKDKEKIEIAYSIFSDVQVIERSTKNPEGPKWYVEFTYMLPGNTFYSNTCFSFCESCLESDIEQQNDAFYQTEGIEGIFEIEESDTLTELKKNFNK